MSGSMTKKDFLERENEGRLELKNGESNWMGSFSGGSTPYYGSAEVLSLTPTNLTLLPGESGSFTCIVRSDAIPFLRWVKRLENPAEAEMNVYNYNGELLEVSLQTFSSASLSLLMDYFALEKTCSVPPPHFSHKSPNF